MHVPGDFLTDDLFEASYELPLGDILPVPGLDMAEPDEQFTALRHRKRNRDLLDDAKRP